jgi:hypothetical protein
VAPAAKPTDLKRPAVVVMVLLCMRRGTRFTGHGQELAALLIHVRIRTGNRTQPLFLRKVRVPWTTGPGVRSMARAAVLLGQPIVIQPALRAGCFHGTDCVWIAKNLQAKSFHGNRGPFSKGAKNCFVQHIPCEIGLKPAQPATRPVFWTPVSGPSLTRQAARAVVRATWSADHGPGPGEPGDRPPGARTRCTRSAAGGPPHQAGGPPHQARGYLVGGHRHQLRAGLHVHANTRRATWSGIQTRPPGASSARPASSATRSAGHRHQLQAAHQVTRATHQVHQVIGHQDQVGDYLAPGHYITRDQDIT